MIDNIDFEVESIQFKQIDGNIKVIELPELSEEEKSIIDPMVAPTSGLRIQIYDIDKSSQGTTYSLTRGKLFLFLRVFKAISLKFKEMDEHKNLNVLIVTDDRPSSEILLNYSSQIFAYQGYEIYHQKDEAGKSRVSSPYGAASVALYEEIDLIIVLTASHNDLSWNGIKFYIDYPIPISGDLFKDVSKKALKINQIELQTDYTLKFTDAIQKNNDYVRELLSKIIDIRSLEGENIVVWPYLGKAEGIIKLYRDYGANVHLIEENLNPPNPIKVVKEQKLQRIMKETDSNLALLLDADRDRIALYVKQNGEFSYYIPNEIYSATHNILAKEFKQKIINVRTIPSDLRGDHTSFLNVLTGVGYKHLGVILYFLFGVEVDQSKIDSAILYMEGNGNQLIQIKEPTPLKNEIIKKMEAEGLENARFIVVMWEESGGHTLNILNVQKKKNTQNYEFSTPLPLIADKYIVPALVLVTELLSRGYIIKNAIDWSIKGINQTIEATDREKLAIMENFEKEDGKDIAIGEKTYHITALYDNNENIEIYKLKSEDSTLYFRPSGTGPEVRFYIFGDRDTYLEEIKKVKKYVKKHYV
ncbi:MAG: hypothetical protein BAJALOKI3v1_760016 [Promethearchaeota archaeon]|nr:MAG: hypothetical protein BAJALOKI3v1_760016 [Candidatus Lokiarchaeota archaeon]